MIVLSLNLLSFGTLSFGIYIVLPYAEGNNMAISELLLTVTSLFLVSLDIFPLECRTILILTLDSSVYLS